MRVEFLKDEKITFQSNEISEIKKGDLVEVDKINQISSTLLAFYIKKGIVKMETEIVEIKSSNPVIENKAIDPVEENKSEQEEMKTIKKELNEKGIKWHHRAGLEKLKQLIGKK